jgi:vacuolar-type H+-ATPase subunit I/STV1
MADTISRLQASLLHLTQELDETLRVIQNSSDVLTTPVNYNPNKAKERAENILKKIFEVEVQIFHLPKQLRTDEEIDKELQQLILENEKIDVELNQARQNAEKAQKTISKRLKNLTQHIYQSHNEDNKFEDDSKEDVDNDNDVEFKDLN